eukprot:EG_transcript_20386
MHGVRWLRAGIPLPRPLPAAVRATGNTSTAKAAVDRLTSVIVDGQEVCFRHCHGGPAAGEPLRVPPLVLVHGAGCDSRMWPEALLKYGGHCVGVDLPGHGRSPPAGPKSVAEYAALVAGVAEQVADLPSQVPGGVVLAGHSMGGAVVQAVAARWPGLVRGLVLVNTGFTLRVSSTLLKALEDADYNVAVDMLTESAFDPTVDRSKKDLMREMLRCAGPATALNDFRACHAYEPPSNLPLAVPTLIVTSEHDKLVGRKSAKALREKVSTNCTHQVVPQSAHMTPLDNPDALTPLIVAWLQQQPWQ